MNNSKQLCKSSPNQVQFKTISRLQEWLHYKICAFGPFFLMKYYEILHLIKSYMLHNIA